MAQRRKKTLVEFLRDGEMPHTIMVTPVVCPDPDHKGNTRRYVGTLLLTERGALFAQHTEYRSTEGEKSVFLGLVGGILDSLEEKTKRHGASADLMTMEPKDALGLVERAEQLFYCPLDAIRKISAGVRGMRIKTNTMAFAFEWIKPKETIKPRRAVVDAYVKAVRMGRDIAAECADAISIRGTATEP